MSSASSSRRSGPYQSATTSQAIRRAAFAALAERGYQSLSLTAVAQQAGVGKSAIYRRWSSKQRMVVELVAEVATGQDLFPDTGALQTDLKALFDQGARHLTDNFVARIVPDLLAEAARDSELGAALYRDVGQLRRDEGVKMIRRAVERGELPVDVDTELAADLIAAPLYWRLAVTRQPFPAGDRDRLVAATIAGLRAT